LLLAGRGIMEGRKCSGRPPALSREVKLRFIQMVKASCDAVSRPAFDEIGVPGGTRFQVSSSPPLYPARLEIQDTPRHLA